MNNPGAEGSAWSLDSRQAEHHLDEEGHDNKPEQITHGDSRSHVSVTVNCSTSPQQQSTLASCWPLPYLPAFLEHSGSSTLGSSTLGEDTVTSLTSSQDAKRWSFVGKAHSVFSNCSTGPELLFGLQDQQVPEFLRAKHIVSGYRLGGNYGSCFRSLFCSWHNESLNAWTMVLSSVLSTIALLYCLVHYNIAGVSSSGFLLLWASAVVHMPFSVGYHTFAPISARVRNLWRRLDISFICIGAVLQAFAMSFYVMPEWWQVALLTAVAGCTAVWYIHRISLMQDHEGLNKLLHTCCMVVVCSAYLFPMLFRSALDAEVVGPTPTLWASISTFLCLFLGATFYALCIPEKFKPGLFDVVGSSHQIMHVFVMGAHLSQYIFLVDNYLRHWQVDR